MHNSYEFLDMAVGQPCSNTLKDLSASDDQVHIHKID